MTRQNGPNGPPAQRAASSPPPRPDVRWGGLTETQALEQILGIGKLTGDRRADLLRAMAVILDWQRMLPHRRGLILHGLYSEFKGDNGFDVYEEIGRQIGLAAGVEDIPKATVHRWAHPPNWESLRGATSE